MEPDSLTAFESFSKFSREEARELLRLMRRWYLRKGTVVFTEGTLGGTCFVIVEGAIDVSINARGQHQRLATLQAGSVFGQMSLVDAAPRSATCSVRADAVMLEIEGEPCEKLLSSGSALALKFLATLNEGLILALRSADLRLMQLEHDNVRMVGYVGAGGAAHLYDVASSHLDKITPATGIAENGAAMEVRGNSVGPYFNRWYVFYDDVRRPMSSAFIGQLCGIGLPDRRILIKQVQRGTREGLYNLHSATEKTITDARIEWATRVNAFARSS